MPKIARHCHTVEAEEMQQSMRLNMERPSLLRINLDMLANPRGPQKWETERNALKRLRGVRSRQSQSKSR
jgi:hypothetical protein